MPTKDEINLQLKLENPLWFLEMNEMQQKFIRMKNPGGYTPKRRLAEAGNKSGKTRIGISEDIAHAIGKRIWLKETSDVRVAVKVTGWPRVEGLEEEERTILVAGFTTRVSSRSA